MTAVGPIELGANPDRTHSTQKPDNRGFKWVFLTSVKGVCRDMYKTYPTMQCNRDNITENKKNSRNRRCEANKVFQ